MKRHIPLNEIANIYGLGEHINFSGIGNFFMKLKSVHSFLHRQTGTNA
jgi:hypothetical protein